MKKLKIEIAKRKNLNLKNITKINAVRNIMNIDQKYINPDFLCKVPPLRANNAISALIKLTIPPITWSNRIK